MNNPTAQDRLPANLAVLRQSLKEMATAMTKEKPVQGPVLVAKGEEVGDRIVPPTSSGDLRQKIA